MLVRLLLPAIAWIILMTLVLFRTYDSEYNWDYGVVKKDHLIHFSLFLVCAHIWMGIFIKQLKFGFLRQIGTGVRTADIQHVSSMLRISATMHSTAILKPDPHVW